MDLPFGKWARAVTMCLANRNSNQTRNLVKKQCQRMDTRNTQEANIFLLPVTSLCKCTLLLQVELHIKAVQKKDRIVLSSCTLPNFCKNSSDDKMEIRNKRGWHFWVSSLSRTMWHCPILSQNGEKGKFSLQCQFAT